MAWRRTMAYWPNFFSISWRILTWRVSANPGSLALRSACTKSLKACSRRDSSARVCAKLLPTTSTCPETVPISLCRLRSEPRIKLVGHLNDAFCAHTSSQGVF